MGNKGAFIRFEAPDLKPNIVSFSAVVSSFPHAQSPTPKPHTTKLENEIFYHYPFLVHLLKFTWMAVWILVWVKTTTSFQ